MKVMKMKCDICNREIEERKDENGNVYWKHGNNAAPYEGRCCDVCDCMIVIPTRLGMINPQAILLGMSLLETRFMSPEDFEKMKEGEE